jgi:cysteine desulfurase
MTGSIYLDHNATTPILPEVADAMREAALQFPANPASQHELGRRSRRALEGAREQVAQLLGARTTGVDADRVIFTSGGTEAANLAILGLLGPPSAAQHLVTTHIEHPCILETASRLSGCRVDRISPDSDGLIQPERLREVLCTQTSLVSVMLANNETGVLQPVAQIAALCAELGVPLHSDASQAVGKIPVDFTELNLAAMSLAAHKFRGPVGIGALVVRHDLPLEPLLWGGHQQAGIRPGTEAVALAIGMAKALECWCREADELVRRITQLRALFEQTLTAALPFVEVVGAGAARLPNTSNLAFVGLNRQALLMALDQAGIACSSGSACASGSSEPSPVLLAMGLKKEVLEGSLRFSLGSTTTARQIEDACRRILLACKHLR